jgi:hypothetical protein
MIDGSAFSGTEGLRLTMEEANCHFQLLGDFLLDMTCARVIRYFGFDPNLTLRRDIEVLGSGSFSQCDSLSPLAFESGSKLRRIEAFAFHQCSSLKSIFIRA